MEYKTELPWSRINDFLLTIGCERTSRGLCVKTLQEIAGLVPYDVAALFLLGENGKSYEQVLAGMDPKWSNAYLDYYSKVENGRFSYYNDPADEKDWNNFKNSEFVTDYIKPQRFNCSAAIKFYSADFSLRGALGLNRYCRSGFTQCEKDILRIIRSHLLNLHSNLFVTTPFCNGMISAGYSEKSLTKRETEIARLLCNGMSPAKISKKYFLSLRTVYKHIENIHEKLNVSNRQELLVKLLTKN